MWRWWSRWVPPAASCTARWPRRCRPRSSRWRCPRHGGSRGDPVVVGKTHGFFPKKNDDFLFKHHGFSVSNDLKNMFWWFLMRAKDFSEWWVFDAFYWGCKVLMGWAEFLMAIGWSSMCLMDHPWIKWAGYLDPVFWFSLKMMGMIVHMDMGRHLSSLQDGWFNKV